MPNLCSPSASGPLAHRRLRRLGAIVVAAMLLALPSRASAAEDQLYARRPSLQETLLATRAELDRWQAGQTDARRSLRIGTWHRAALGSEAFDPVAVTRDGIAPGAQGKPGSPPWTACPADSQGNPNLSGAGADYLYVTIVAERPTALTLELSRHEGFGGFAYRPPPSGAGIQPTDALVWLNGRQVTLRDKLEGYARVPVAKRRGWHEAALVDLPLARGENRLVVSLNKGARKGWFTTVRVSSNPAAALWAMVEHDFPRSRNRLLEAVDAAWFDPAGGWFAHGTNTDLERQFLQAAVDGLGPDGAALAQRCDALVKANSPASDPRWLDLCVTAAELQTALREVESLRRAIETLQSAYAKYPGGRLSKRVADLRRRLVERASSRLDPAEESSRRLFEELSALGREALVTENPLLADKRLLFVKRAMYDSDHYYDEFNAGIRRFGGGLFTLSIRDGQVLPVAPQLADGLVDRYDLSFDARRIVFNYKPPRPVGYRIFEIGVDGSGLRQLTFPPADEAQRIATYAMCPLSELEKNPCRYGHWTDDMHPCYLPDGGIVFTSTRTERSVLCGGHSLTVTNLHRMNADGTGLRALSQGALSEFCPTVMEDGRVMYNRWEYVDKGAGAVQSLWAMVPDGSRSEEIYGNNIGTPPVYNQARHVPGASRVVCLGAGHCPGNIGAILLVDLHKNKRFPEAMTALTPGCVPKGNWGLRQYRNGRWMVDIYGPWYADPFPLADRSADALSGKFFLVSCNPEGMWNDEAGYGLYLLDVFGNRVPIYRDATTSCWQARPLEPRPMPPVLAGVSATADAAEKEATLVVADVYQGLDGVKPGTVKYLRVMEQVPRPWSVVLGYHGNDSSPGQMAAISLYTHLSVKVLHGVVPVHEDGSACFTVPARRNVFFQALDGDFMEVQRMRTFVNFQPGERRSCVGCHEHRN
ncbi:MAG: hypothetical protein NUV77_15510, partial [Thermoguttaceae bacterium]|nr:hypothetical protein [Thermoguttaceae bacterium]